MLPESGYKRRFWLLTRVLSDRIWTVLLTRRKAWARLSIRRPCTGGRVVDQPQSTEPADVLLHPIICCTSGVILPMFDSAPEFEYISLIVCMFTATKRHLIAAPSVGMQPFSCSARVNPACCTNQTRLIASSVSQNLGVSYLLARTCN